MSPNRPALPESLSTLQPTIQGVLSESLYDRGDVIGNWPDDEAAAYRENGRFLEGAEAARQVSLAKAAQAVLAALQPSIEALTAAARQAAFHEAAGIVHARIRDREQPFTIQTQDGIVASGEGPAWAVPDLQLVEKLIRQRADAEPALDPNQPATNPEGEHRQP